MIPKILPYLWHDNATVTVAVRNGEIEDGHEVTTELYSGPCNLSQTEKRVQDKEGVYIPLAGIIHIKGDIAPDLVTYDCTVSINGQEYAGEAKKLRNPDGSINHTRIVLR